MTKHNTPQEEFYTKIKYVNRAVATRKTLVRPKYEECEKKDDIDGKSCEARQAVHSAALLQLGVWGGGGGAL